MPQVLIDHTAGLDVDWPSLTEMLHRVVPEVIGAEVAACKTVRRPAELVLVGDGGSGEALVLVEVKILAGRDVGKRAELTRRVLDLLRAYVTVPAAFGVQVTELDRDTYRFEHHPAR
ncbi:5-carboxymethyl-2-hydroxymuconate Delta-isomerase [Kitasatospora sp. NPDC096147]|uniref:5-carboxymethyl-2-hydroxymuconate Delta-isomerase n=1 Tax=Kitasatospora sp. NPDC096147 TaxID=3364093 RepID=UPI00381824EB